jgi:hypothetical protein
MSNVFGNLRSLLQRPASKALWDELCEVVDGHVGRVDEAQWHEIVAYTRGVLRHWPIELCQAPERWVNAMFEGEQVAQLAVARAIDTRGRDVGDEQIFEMTLTPALSQLASLSMGYSQRVAWRPERLDYGCVRELCTCPHFGALRTLRITGQHLLPDSFASILDCSNAFASLETLDFSFNDLNFLKPSDLERLTFHPIKHIYLRSSNLSSQGVQVLESISLLHGIETLDLSNNYQLTHTDLIHLLGYDSRVFANLRTLHLCAFDLEQGQLPELFRAMPQARLEHLDLSGCMFHTYTDAEEIMAILACESLCGLRQLTLDRVGLGERDHCIEELWPAHFHALKRISLQHNFMNSAHNGWLGGLIASGVQWLDLSHNLLGDESVLDILKSFEHAPLATPCTIVLNHNYMDPDSEDTALLRELGRSCGITLEITAYTRHLTVEEEQALYDNLWGD